MYSVYFPYVLRIFDTVNNKTIYENDIVKWDNGVGLVYWNEKMACFDVKGFYSQSQDCPCCAFSENHPFEIIGSSWKNPELLA